MLGMTWLSTKVSDVTCCVCRDNNRNPHRRKWWLLCTKVQTPRALVSAPSIRPGGPCFHTLILPWAPGHGACSCPPNTCDSALLGWRSRVRGLDSPLCLL